MKRLIEVITSSVSTLQSFLVSLISAVKHLSKIIADLVIMGINILFYIAPFALMVLVGLAKSWWWMTISGSFMLILILIFSIGKGIPEQKDDNNLKKIKFIFGTVTFILSLYYILFSMQISLEKELLSLIKLDNNNLKANKIRESQYLLTLKDTSKNNFIQYQEAIIELGKIKSENAVEPLIEKLQALNLVVAKIDDDSYKLAIAIIDALSTINSESQSACNALIKIETSTQNNELKMKSKKAANKVCK